MPDVFEQFCSILLPTSQAINTTHRSLQFKSVLLVILVLLYHGKQVLGFLLLLALQNLHFTILNFPEANQQARQEDNKIIYDSKVLL